MAPRKNRPLLIEVVMRPGKGRAPAKRADGAAAPTPAGPDAGNNLAATGAGDAAAPATAFEFDQPAPLDAAPRAIRFADGKLHLILGWPELAILAVFLVSVAAGFFYAGGQSVRASLRPAPPVDPIPRNQTAPTSDERGAQPPERLPHSDGVMTPERNGGAEDQSSAPPEEKSPAAPSPAAFAPRKGYQYLVLQYFGRRNRSLAEKAAAFVRERGVECAVIARGPDWCVVATEPFLVDQKDAAAARAERQRADSAKQQILKIGTEYDRAGGGYRFDLARLEVLAR